MLTATLQSRERTKSVFRQTKTAPGSKQELYDPFTIHNLYEKDRIRDKLLALRVHHCLFPDAVMHT